MTWQLPKAITADNQRFDCKVNGRVGARSGTILAGLAILGDESKAGGFYVGAVAVGHDRLA